MNGLKAQSKIACLLKDFETLYLDVVAIQKTNIIFNVDGYVLARDFAFTEDPATRVRERIPSLPTLPLKISAMSKVSHLRSLAIFVYS